MNKCKPFIGYHDPETCSDLKRLDAALGSPYWQNQCEGPLAKVISDAARAYRDLLANGKRVDWCEEHEAAVYLLDGVETLQCDVWVVAGLEGWYLKAPCRMVSRLLVDQLPRRSR